MMKSCWSQRVRLFQLLGGGKRKKELTGIVRASIQDESRRMHSFYKFSIRPPVWLYQSKAALGSPYLQFP